MTIGPTELSADAWAALPSALSQTFIIFCRVGSCLLLVPGFSNTRIPTQVRLFVALGITIALAPVIGTKIEILQQSGSWAMTRLIFIEAARGALIGLLARCFMAALEFAAEAAASGVGLMSQTAAISENEPSPAFTTLITGTATALIFAGDQHWEIIRGLAASYSIMPVGDAFQVRPSLISIAQVFSKAFLLTLQVCSPFIVYAIFINMLFGFLNKIAPQIPVFFISAPFIAAGGLALLYLVADESLTLFSTVFASWLVTG